MKRSLLAVAVACLGPLPAHAASMATGTNGYSIPAPLFTVGESIKGYTPPGKLDGLGAYELDACTVRVLANHELRNHAGYAYELSDGHGGNFTLTGARISYLDIDRQTRQLVAAGPAYHSVHDASGRIASGPSFLAGDRAGFSRFCSGVLVNAGAFNARPHMRVRFGLEDTIYFTGEEVGGQYNRVGGAEWALDVANGELWQIPAMGRGAWENIAPLDTGNTQQVAFILADDTSPHDVDHDGIAEAAPLYLYLGRKSPAGDFLQRNGLADGRLHVFVADNGATRPADFHSAGSIDGHWVAVDNTPAIDRASADGASGHDRYGYPTQGNLWLQARALGAFGFSRPEDVAYRPADPAVAVLASTGARSYDIDAATGNGVDTFGTVYTVSTDFSDLSVQLGILYDGDADPTRALRSPDNLDWADNDRIFVQEDKAADATASGDEVLFGADARNPGEAGIVMLDPRTGTTLRVASIDRDVTLDASLAIPSDAIDVDAGMVGAWETSGILDVSSLFGEAPGSLLLFNVQAHGIEDQAQFNAGSRIVDNDLVEGGQLLWLQAPGN